MHCKTCKFWKPCEPNGYDWDYGGGYCCSPKLDEDYGKHEPDMLVYSYTEGGGFWTGPEFGCVHHCPK